MHANELRIGNYFYALEESGSLRARVPIKIPMRVGSVDKFGEIKVIEPSSPKTYIYQYGWYTGIPIDNKVLAACKASGEWWEWLLFEKPRSMKIVFLHELQNLYFAVTREEINYIP